MQKTHLGVAATVQLEVIIMSKTIKHRVRLEKRESAAVRKRCKKRNATSASLWTARALQNRNETKRQTKTIKISKAFAKYSYRFFSRMSSAAKVIVSILGLYVPRFEHRLCADTIGG